jgi:hypothetical protein
MLHLAGQLTIGIESSSEFFGELNMVLKRCHNQPIHDCDFLFFFFFSNPAPPEISFKNGMMSLTYAMMKNKTKKYNLGRTGCVHHKDEGVHHKEGGEERGDR